MKKIKISTPYFQICNFFSTLLLTLTSCNEDKYYTCSDFIKVNKTNTQMHDRTTDPGFLFWADSLKFKLATPNTETIRDQQFQTATFLKFKYLDRFAFCGIFSTDNWSEPEFVETTITRKNKVMKAVALGIKIWKNICMEYITISRRVPLIQ
jgi:hypothetical protein